MVNNNKYEVVVVGLRQRAKRPGLRDVVFKQKQVKMVQCWSGQDVVEYNRLR